MLTLFSSLSFCPLHEMVIPIKTVCLKLQGTICQDIFWIGAMSKTQGCYKDEWNAVDSFKNMKPLYESDC